MASYKEILKTESYWVLSIQNQFGENIDKDLSKCIKRVVKAALLAGKAPILELRNLDDVIEEKLKNANQ